MLLTCRPVINMPPSRILIPCLIVLYSILILNPVESTIIRSLIKNNVAGPDVNFQEAEWHFDPDAGPRRSKEYQKINGVLGWKAIERVGLGEDGLTEERKQQQQYRDSIGALTYKVPGYDV